MGITTVPFQWLETIYVRLDERKVRRHLRHTEEFLRTRPVNLSPEAVTHRQQNLDRLRDYWQNAPLPRNTTQPDHRTPCFIDEQGHCCAVAHLVIEAGYKEAVHIIAAEANEAYIHDMHFPILDEWAAQSGLSKDELALIQPSYCPPAEYGYQFFHAAFYVIAFGFFAGLLGGPVAIWNFLRGMTNNRLNKALYRMGLLTGFVFYGVAIILLGMMVTGNTVMLDYRAIQQANHYGFNGEPCTLKASEVSGDFITHAGIGNVLIGLVGGSIFLAAAQYSRNKAAPKLPRTSIASLTNDLALPTLIGDAPKPPTG
jgi:hypothetical protein